MTRLVIAAGGTGGHVYPGVAVAAAVRARFPAAAVLFVGTGRLEARVIPPLGWPFARVAARPLSRRIGPGLAASALVNGCGTLQAVGRLRRFQPEAVLATGGYAAGPVGLAAALLRIPLVIQEQNVVPGLANRWLARWAWAVSIPPGGETGFRRARAVVTGVPIRPELLRGDSARGRAAFGFDPRAFTILVLGGSQGARTLNRAVEGAGTLLMFEPWQILHQTGAEDLEMVRREIGRREHVGPPVLRHVAVPFIEEMGDAYAAADLVVCRAGASTLAEVAAWGRPAVLIPYPHAIAGEQWANARIPAAAGAAEVIDDAALTPLRLAEVLSDLIRAPQRLQRMAAASRALARPDAADRVVDLLVGAAATRSVPAPGGGRQAAVRL